MALSTIETDRGPRVVTDGGPLSVAQLVAPRSGPTGGPVLWPLTLGAKNHAVAPVWGGQLLLVAPPRVALLVGVPPQANVRQTHRGPLSRS